jgi:hypothetical protein
VAALGQLSASWTTRGVLNVNIDQKSIVNLLDPIQYQVLSWQDRLRMARGRCHCKLSLKQYDPELFWAILTLTQSAPKVRKIPKIGHFDLPK